MPQEYIYAPETTGLTYRGTGTAPAQAAFTPIPYTSPSRSTRDSAVSPARSVYRPTSPTVDEGLLRPSSATGYAKPKLPGPPRSSAPTVSPPTNVQSPIFKSNRKTVSDKVFDVAYTSYNTLSSYLGGKSGNPKHHQQQQYPNQQSTQQIFNTGANLNPNGISSPVQHTPMHGQVRTPTRM